jgi:hypothetical protein
MFNEWKTIQTHPKHDLLATFGSIRKKGGACLTFVAENALNMTVPICPVSTCKTRIFLHMCMSTDSDANVSFALVSPSWRGFCPVWRSGQMRFRRCHINSPWRLEAVTGTKGHVEPLPASGSGFQQDSILDYRGESSFIVLRNSYFRTSCDAKSGVLDSSVVYKTVNVHHIVDASTQTAASVNAREDRRGGRHYQAASRFPAGLGHHYRSDLNRRTKSLKWNYESKWQAHPPVRLAIVSLEIRSTEEMF